MDYLVGWRSRLPDCFRLFSALTATDKRISVTYGVVGSALLWGVREDSGSAELPKVLAGICDAVNVGPLLRAVEVLGGSTPLDGARALSRMAAEDEGLSAQLDRLIAHFLEDCLRYELLKRPAEVHVAGSVEGANVVIGGVQYVAGDLLISQTVVRKRHIVRPIAPDPPPHFAGRATELAQLRVALSQGRNVAITGIHGMGGIGKTATALRLAADMSEFGVVLWASLGPAPNPVALLVDWARHADPEFMAGDGPVDGLANRVRAALTDLVRDHFPGRVLVVLDDVWEGESVAAARQLRAASPTGSVHLITTRSRQVVAQLRSTGLELRPMESDDAILMLRNLLSDLPDLTEDDLRELAEVVGHHPLAMELAAGQVQLLERPDAEIGELLALYRGGIPAGSPFRDIRLELGEAREDNLELVLSFSYDRLDGADQARFRTLGVLAYGADFDRSLCEAIWGGDPKPVLDRFRHRALLSPAAAPGWYHQHQLLRSYARALLHGKDKDRSRAEDDYTACVVDICARFGDLPVQQWNELNPYIGHVEEAGTLIVSAAQPELRAERPDRALLDRILTFALHTRHLLAMRTELHHPEWLSAGVAVSRFLGESSHEVVLLNALAQRQRTRGNSTAAIRTLYEARQRADSVGDTAGTAMTHSNLGALMLQYDPDTAPQWLYRSVELWTQLNDQPQLAQALLRLADWQSNEFRTFAERTTAIESLSHAASIAQEHNLTDVHAEVFLKLGRLFDTLGDQVAAARLLNDAVGQFELVGQRDREGLARLFLAAALARDEPDHAAGHLKTAVSLFATTGHAAGQATALRNLAQLHAESGRHAEALVAHADALPLVRLVTEEFTDEDDVEEFVVPGHFDARYEKIARLDEVEQYRANGRAQFDLSTDAAGKLPDDLMCYLLTQTIRVGTSSPEARQEWAAALRQFIDQADGLHTQHTEFVRNLLDVTLDRPSSATEGTPYVQTVADVRTQIEQLRETGRRSHLTGEDALRCARRTLDAIVHQPGQRQDWERVLRNNLCGARIWGDFPTEDYFRSLLCVLGGQPAALPLDHPHRAVLDWLLDKLFEHQRLPTHVLLERTVTTRTVLPDKLAEWTNHLQDARRESAWRGDRWGEEFISALIALASGDQPAVQDDNPYRDDVARTVDAITKGTLLFCLIPQVVLADLVDAVVAARTDRPKTTDGLANRLGNQAEDARGIGRYADADLYDALVQILQGGSPQLAPRHPYEGVLDVVADAIGVRRRAPCADQTLPDDHVAWLVDFIVSTQVGAPEGISGVHEYFAAYRSILEARGDDWKYEANFISALGDLLDGQQPELAPESPYGLAVQRTKEELQRITKLKSVGGKLSVASLKSLLDTATEHLRARQAFFEAFASGMPDDRKAIEGFLRETFEGPQLRRSMLMQNQWEHDLLVWRDDLVRRGPEWRYEVELVDAVIALVKIAPAERLSPDSPYTEVVRELTETVPRIHEMPADESVAALALDRKEYTESRVPGMAGARRDLDVMLAYTALSRTTSPDQYEHMMGVLQSRSTALAANSAVLPERELIDALARILRDEDLGLPAGHQYETEYLHVKQSIDLFHGRLTWPGSLTGDLIMRLAATTADVLTKHRYHLDVWREQLGRFTGEHANEFPDDRETHDFLRALAILLEGRTAHLSQDNRYNPYLIATRNHVRFFSE